MECFFSLKIKMSFGRKKMILKVISLLIFVFFVLFFTHFDLTRVLSLHPENDHMRHVQNQCINNQESMEILSNNSVHYLSS